MDNFFFIFRKWTNSSLCLSEYLKLKYFTYTFLKYLKNILLVLIQLLY